MTTIWVAFLATAVALLALAVVGLRWKGEKAAVLHMTGRFLFALAAVTALFPSLLSSLGPARWAVLYATLVVVLTAAMTMTAVMRARRLKS